MKKKIALLLTLCMTLSLFAGFTSYAAQDPDAAEHRDSYDDVDENHWAYPWVTYMTERSYIHGYPPEDNNGLYMYKPGQDITRAEFACILYYMIKPEGPMTETFSDVNINDWFYYFIDGAVAAGYMSGCGDGTMRPNDFITREEASSIVYRAFGFEKYTKETNFLDKDDISDWAYEAVMSLAQLGVVVGYTGEEEDVRTVSPKTNILRAEVASLLANAEETKNNPPVVTDEPVVTFSEATVTYDEKTAVGKVAFDMFPKNTSDTLYADISLDDGTLDFTITYTVDGVEKTVTREEFKATPFTTEQLENMKTVVNIEDVGGGMTVKVYVDVRDDEKGNVENDKVVGSTIYEATFGKPGDDNGSFIDYGDDGYTRKYNVTFDLPENSDDPGAVQHPDDKTVSVKSGSQVSKSDIPQHPNADTGYAYIWTDEEGNIVNPALEYIRKDRTFTASEDIDRVIIALQTYQDMKGKGTGVTTTDVFFFNMNHTTDGFVQGNDAHNNDHNPVTNKVWWTTDVLEIIVTNDNNHLKDGEFTGVTAQKALKTIYDDVARFVVDNSEAFDKDNVKVDSTNKLTYVKFFRAMIRTIDNSAINAADAYWNARQNGGNKDTAYDEFKLLAVINGASSLNEALKAEGLSDTASLGNSSLEESLGLALSYVADLYAKVDNPEGTLKNKLAELYTAAAGDQEAFRTAVAEYIAASFLYSKAKG